MSVLRKVARGMKMWGLARVRIAVLVPVALLGWIAAVAAEETKPRSLDPKPKQAVERPFGGPPNRTPPGMGMKCAAAAVTCAMEEPRKIGADCLCPGENGRTIEGRVVR
jgi:hypothetical protein